MATLNGGAQKEILPSLRPKYTFRYHPICNIQLFLGCITCKYRNKGSTMTTKFERKAEQW